MTSIHRMILRDPHRPNVTNQSTPRSSEVFVQLFTEQYAPIQKVLLQHLELVDEIRLMSVCKILRVAYLRSWDINKTLKCVVNNPPRFREHVRACGGLIAGRLIYEFFARIVRPRTAIMIYLRNCPNVPLTRYLVEEEGFKYCAHDPGVPPPTSAAPGPCRVDANLHTTTFSRTRDVPVTIMLVIAPTHPIETMLRCNHLSAAMNFLTHDKAVCVFPLLTFIRKLTLIFQRLIDQPVPITLWQDLLRFSEDCGWTQKHYLNLWTHDEEESGTLSFTKRRVGDLYTWILPIEPAPAFNEALLPSRSRTDHHRDPPPDFDPFLNRAQAHRIQRAMPRIRWDDCAFNLDVGPLVHLTLQDSDDSSDDTESSAKEKPAEWLEFFLECVAINQWDEEDVEEYDELLLIESLEG